MANGLCLVAGRGKQRAARPSGPGPRATGHETRVAGQGPRRVTSHLPLTASHLYSDQRNMPSRYDLVPLEFDRLHRFPLSELPGKVSVRQFGKPWSGVRAVSRFLDTLPRILGAQDLREIVRAVVKARRGRRAIVWGIGGHVIKVGLGPVLGDLIARGYVSGLAMNGAALVHDLEIALAGKTSEDVEARLGRGRFGMAEDTGRYANDIAREACRDGIGMGEAAGRFLGGLARFGRARVGRGRARYPGQSVLVAAYRARVPVTVHLAIGTDTPHMHPSADGAALGEASLRDFRLFCALVRKMQPGGLYLNWGSAVVLPEVFLKAVTAVRNLGVPLRPITTANFDFLQHYRGRENVVRRPTREGGSRGYAVTGHHEILLPLVAAALAEADRGRGKRLRKQR